MLEELKETRTDVVKEFKDSNDQNKNLKQGVFIIFKNC